MWLRLDLEGMKVQLQIKGYQPSSRDYWDFQWCKVDFAFAFPECINYTKQDDEVLLSCEVEELEAKLDDFINDKIIKSETLEFIEPDFVFELRPGYNKVEAGVCSYAAPGHEMSAAFMAWKVRLWQDGLTDNYFSTTLDKEDMRILRDYLRLVMGKLSKDCIEIRELVAKGMIGGQF